MRHHTEHAERTGIESTPEQRAARHGRDLDRRRGDLQPIEPERSDGWQDAPARELLGEALVLEHCVSDSRQRLPATRIEMPIECDLSRSDAGNTLALFRLLQASMTDGARHARASRAGIQIVPKKGEHECIEARIVDGCGSDLRLIGMRQRAAAVGGSLTLSSEPGAGFGVAATLPLGVVPSAGSPV